MSSRQLVRLTVMLSILSVGECGVPCTGTELYLRETKKEIMDNLLTRFKFCAYEMNNVCIWCVVYGKRVKLKH